MTEAPYVIYHATAKPEQPKPEKSKAVGSIRKAVDKWLDRIGPKGIENRFVTAHENVLATLDSDQRKEVFAKEVDVWRKTGKIIGVTATVIDTALIAYTGGLAFLGFRNPLRGAELYENMISDLASDPPSGRSEAKLHQWVISNALQLGEIDESGIYGYALHDEHVIPMGRAIARIPAFASLTMLFGSGPVHWLAHLAATGAEQISKLQAKSPSKK